MEDLGRENPHERPRFHCLTIIYEGSESYSVQSTALNIPFIVVTTGPLYDYRI